MPSSLVFAALAAAWIVVLVPMVARHRQEVRRTADSALAARVLRRGDPSELDVSYDSGTDSPYTGYDGYNSAYDSAAYSAYSADSARSADSADSADEYEAARPVARRPERQRHDQRHDDWPEEASDMADDELPARDTRYRPGRGGFDPAAAELAARAKYAFRQRVVLFLLLMAVITGVFALVMVSALWWAHVASDVVLAGYLAYLRRQVRIEQEVRRRRMDRVSRRRARPVDEHADEPGAEASADESMDEPPARRATERPVHPGALVIDLDDEDPGLWDLDAGASTPYRRAVGE